MGLGKNSVSKNVNIELRSKIRPKNAYELSNASFKFFCSISIKFYNLWNEKNIFIFFLSGQLHVIIYLWTGILNRQKVAKKY